MYEMDELKQCKRCKCTVEQEDLDEDGVCIFCKEDELDNPQRDSE